LTWGNLKLRREKLAKGPQHPPETVADKNLHSGQHIFGESLFKFWRKPET
jgi:hypothetical protein